MMEGMKETIFISHGQRDMPIEESNATRKFLSSWVDGVFCQRPKAILIISAHWDTDEPAVTAVHHHHCSFKEPNFNPLLYELNYKAPGAPELAARVKELLASAGFERVRLDGTRVMDRGAWKPLMLMYPEGDIPVCQLSVQTKEDAAHHYNIGRALAPLKEEGVLILGSGSATHNIPSFSRRYDATPTWALEFDRWLVDALTNGSYDDVNGYIEKAPYAKEAHPTPEHLYPLHVAMGAASTAGNPKAELIHHSWYGATMSCACFKFSPENATQL